MQVRESVNIIAFSIRTNHLTQAHFRMPISSPIMEIEDAFACHSSISGSVRYFPHDALRNWMVIVT
jgi:hypothetical protein